jgi:hypothetical protein
LAKGPVSDDLMMRYLLGDVSDEEQNRLEEYYFVDDSVFAQLLAFEDELIDDYVRGELSVPQRKRFELYFVNSPERRQKLAFAESFTRYLSNAPPADRAKKRETWQQRITDLLSSSGATARWAFAAVFAGILVGGAWLVRENWRLRVELRQMQAEQTDLRQREKRLSAQLDQLTILERESTQSTEVTQSRPPSLPVVALTLFPGALRSNAEQKKLIIPPGPHVVHLQLDLESQSYESYLATLETAEGSRIWSKEGLKTMPESGRRTLVLELPSSLLGNKDYILKLRGIRSGAVQTNQYPGEAQHVVSDEIAAYSFRVIKR